jgi:hypothetical protein
VCESALSQKLFTSCRREERASHIVLLLAGVAAQIYF